jgi:hypothetical protein
VGAMPAAGACTAAWAAGAAAPAVIVAAAAAGGAAVGMTRPMGMMTMTRAQPRPIGRGARARRPPAWRQNPRCHCRCRCRRLLDGAVWWAAWLVVGCYLMVSACVCCVRAVVILLLPPHQHCRPRASEEEGAAGSWIARARAAGTIWLLWSTSAVRLCG